MVGELTPAALAKSHCLVVIKYNVLSAALP